MGSKMFKVFVYGTLKKGEPNYGWFDRHEGGKFKFVCEAKTVEKYPLIIATNYNIPFLLYSPGKGTNVQGELYEVDDNVLKNLDILEDHPAFYIREEKQVQDVKNGTLHTAWIYFIKNFKPELLQRQTYESYSNNASHGLKYVERYLRNENSDYSEESTLDDLNKV